jgi:sialic acid synthase SpsE
VTEADIAILRPGTGLAPARIATVAGRRTTRPVEAGTAVAPDDVESPS